MTEILKAMGWAATMLLVAFFGRDVGLSHGQVSSLIVILICGYTAMMKPGRPCKTKES